MNRFLKNSIAIFGLASTLNSGQILAQEKSLDAKIIEDTKKIESGFDVWRFKKSLNLPREARVDYEGKFDGKFFVIYHLGKDADYGNYVVVMSSGKKIQEMNPKTILRYDGGKITYVVTDIGTFYFPDESLKTQATFTQRDKNKEINNGKK
jgi:hypothetical protein